LTTAGRPGEPGGTGDAVSAERSLISKINKDDLQAVAELIESGNVSPVVGQSYALVETPDAIREPTGHAREKLVIAV
jgi:NADPH:quinone reductase-like Zn-dependent oxidoreductase